MVTLTPIDKKLTRMDLVDNYEILVAKDLVTLADKLLIRYIEVMQS